MDLSNIKAVIYDMDGVLIDSEPLWHIAEQQTFARVGIEMTKEMCLETTGLRTDEVIEHWYKKRPWNGVAKTDLERELIANVVSLIADRGEAKPGVSRSINKFRDRGLRISLASSSPYQIISAAIEKLGISGEFEIVYSAQDEKYGKPHPGVYITTAEKMGIRPIECLALEDSLNGVLAAKAARMKCIAVPEPEIKNDPQFAIADQILNSLNDV